MKKLLSVVVSILILSSCTVNIPMQSNLSDQTMLLAKNKNIKANYTLTSNVHDGYIAFVSAMKNGSESVNKTSHKYASETAFRKLWGSYFSSKFNNYSKDEMKVSALLTDLKLRQKSSTSLGMQMLTGNQKVNVEAVAAVHVVVDYHGKKYENQFEVTASEYNESQQVNSGDHYYSINQKNPTQQKSKLLESCLNKSVIQFENFLRSVIVADKENN